MSKPPLSEAFYPSEAIYIVLAWTSAAGETSFIDWLDNGHMAEVIAQPGFRGCRRLRLEQKNDDGWQGHMIIYELDSPASLEAYLKAPVRERFLAEGQKFEGVKMERLNGVVEARL